MTWNPLSNITELRLEIQRPTMDRVRAWGIERPFYVVDSTNEFQSSIEFMMYTYGTEIDPILQTLLDFTHWVELKIVSMGGDYLFKGYLIDCQSNSMQCMFRFTGKIESIEIKTSPSKSPQIFLKTDRPTPEWIHEHEQGKVELKIEIDEGMILL